VTADLIAWMREQLDQEERVALAARASHGMFAGDETAAAGRWRQGYSGGEETGSRIEGDGFIIFAEGGHTAEHAEHIAAWHPVRVLAEIEAKRAVIALCEDSESYERIALQLVVCTMAQPYAGRPWVAAGMGSVTTRNSPSLPLQTI
jgi:Family of unknown function (DUF6221)